MMSHQSPTIHRRKDVNKLVEILTEYHLPPALPLVRRLQFMNFAGGRTSDSCVLASFEKDDTGRSFVVAYLDFSRGPETQMWLFSSLEHDCRQSLEEKRMGEQQVVALFRYVAVMERQFSHSNLQQTTGKVLVGSVHEKVFEILRQCHNVEYKAVPYKKYIFKREDWPSSIPLPSEDLSWGTIRLSDLPLVLSRTSIKRREFVTNTRCWRMNCAVFTTTGSSPVAWGFLGPDGSLASLHCEEDYRGRGLAKAITLKLFREFVSSFGEDGLAHADVSSDNLQSQGVCRSVGGKPGWIVYWVWIQINPLF